MTTYSFGGITGLTLEQRNAAIARAKTLGLKSYAAGSRAALAAWAPVTPPTPPAPEPPPVVVPPTPGTPPAPRVLVRTPTQPGTLAYTGTIPKEYQRPGALVIVDWGNAADPSVKAAAAAGAIVLHYLDAVIRNPDSLGGKYHQALHTGIGNLPGAPKVSQYGWVADLRVGGELQRRFRPVLEQMRADAPWISGVFLDDMGSRTFADSNWPNWSADVKKALWQGAGTLTDTARSWANEWGGFVMVNGTWEAGNGGGWPNAGVHGNANADGTMAEHSPTSDYWMRAYPSSPQWATASPLTNGKPFHFAVQNTAADRDKYVAAQTYAWAVAQTSYLNAVPAPVGLGFHKTGLERTA